MNAIPTVSFALQSVVPNYPDELHEVIVMTPELRSWAVAAQEWFQDRATEARNRELHALHVSRGERAFRRAGGPAAARDAYNTARLVELVRMLAHGCVRMGGLGWIDRGAWALITDAYASH